MNAKKPWEIHHDESIGEEGGMALSNLDRSQSMIGQLQDIIDREDSLPAWVQAKLNSVYEDLDDVHGYMTHLSKHVGEYDEDVLPYNYEEYYDDEDQDFEGDEDEYEDDEDFDDEFSDEYEDEDDVVEGDLSERKRRRKRRKSSKNKGLWYNIDRRRKAGKRPKRPGEEGYPKTLDIKKKNEGLIREMVQLILEKRRKKKKRKCKGTESSPVGSPRQRSFCKRMCGMRRVNTGSKTAKDPDSCINQALRRWRCRCSKLSHQA